jgi:hypothetical protein
MGPAAAGSLFLERAARQLELCRSMLAPESSALERGIRNAAALRIHTAQLESMISLHGQATNEADERSLDASRRLTLLALIQDLFDAVLGSRRGGGQEALGHGNQPEPAELAEALAREREALIASLDSAIHALRGSGSLPTRELHEAHVQVAELRRLRAAAGAPDAQRAFLEAVDARNQIVTRQLALEESLAGWVASARGSS